MPGWWKRRFGQKGETAMTTQEEPKKRGWLAKWRAPKRREQQLATLQEGFNELVELTRSIREHMNQQVQTQKTLLDMMEHIPGAVEGLKSVGKATEQQTETLDLLRKQLEAAARNEDHLVASMQHFNKTLTLMDDMSQRTSQTVSSMADRTRESEDLLRSILERSERRLVYTIVTLVIVTLSVLGAGLYFGLGGRPVSAIFEESEILEEPVPVIEEPETFEHKKSITDLADERSEAPDQEAVEPPRVKEEETEIEDDAKDLPDTDKDVEKAENEEESDADPERKDVETEDPAPEKDDAPDPEMTDDEEAEEKAADEKPAESE